MSDYHAIRVVLEWQQGDGQSTGSEMLSYLDGWYNNGTGIHVKTPHPVNYYLYGGGGSSYYNPDNLSDTLTLDNIWNSETFSLSNWKSMVGKDASITAAYGLKRTAYEGGPSMDHLGHSETVKAQAWKDSRMKNLMISHQKYWETMNGDVFCYYTLGGSSVDGSYQWSLTEQLENPEKNAPKYQAIQELSLTSKAPLTIGKLLPNTFSGSDFSVSNISWIVGGSSISIKAGVDSDTPRWISFNARVSIATTYQITCRFSCKKPCVFQVYLDGKIIATGNIKKGTSSGKLLIPKTAFSKGLHSIRVQCKTGELTVSKIVVT